MRVGSLMTPLDSHTLKSSLVDSFIHRLFENHSNSTEAMGTNKECELINEMFLTRDLINTTLSILSNENNLLGEEGNLLSELFILHNAGIVINSKFFCDEIISRSVIPMLEVSPVTSFCVELRKLTTSTKGNSTG